MSSTTNASAGHFAAVLLDELRGGGGGAAGGEQIVDNQDAVAGGDRAGVHFERVGAVLQIVGDADALAGQLFRLAHGDEAGAERVGQRRGEDEAARFDADHQIDAGVLVVLLAGRR